MIIKDGIAYDIKETEINVKTLEAQKLKLEQTIQNTQLKTKPDEETLELWNSFAQKQIDNNKSIQKKISDIDKTLQKINNLKLEISK